jgi:hypothetical protein
MLPGLRFPGSPKPGDIARSGRDSERESCVIE